VLCLSSCTVISSTSHIRVRYAETDKMGIVYHTNYFEWFEISRVDMLDQIGIPYRELEARGFLLPVLEISAKYRQPAYFDDRIDVTCFIDEPPTLRINVSYEVRRGDDLLATGDSRHVFMTPDGKATKPPRDVLDIFSQRFPKA